MIHIEQAVIVEGKYDQSKLSSLIDATIITTGGFEIFRNRAKLELVRALAKKRGVIILTDSDAAGFKIRSYLAGAVPAEQITHVYIPDILGKERRKAQPSAEGKLGVEGVPVEVLLEALRKAGIAVEPALDAPGAPPAPDSGEGAVTKADLVEWGLSGGENSAELRRKLLQTMKLPARMNANAMLRVVNTLYTRAEFMTLLGKL